MTNGLAGLLAAALVAACVGSRAVPGHMAAQGAREVDGDSADEGATDNEIDPELAPGARVFSGKVSYYSDALAGHRTANGERYDPTLLTAASRNLPFGTMLRVTRIDKPLSVEVRVNDRGPFGRRKRLLDLSRAAAERLDMIRAGVVRVRIEVLSKPQSRPR